MILRAFVILILLNCTSIKAESLIVYGKGFTFSVQEPKGWHGDTKNAAKFHANVIFYPKNKSRNEDTVIRIRVNQKTDNNTKADLEYDKKGYLSKYQNVMFNDIKINHKNYQNYTSVFYIENDFYEYVSYINPGIKEKVQFSVSMNKQRSNASQKELMAFKKAISSLMLF